MTKTVTTKVQPTPFSVKSEPYTTHQSTSNVQISYPNRPYSSHTIFSISTAFIPIQFSPSHF